MKLNRTREEWESYRALHSKQDCAALYHHAVADLLALSAENARLTAQLAEAQAKADDWQAMKDERDAAKIGYANLLDDTNGEIKGLRAQLAEREGIARELATTIKALYDGKHSQDEIWRMTEAALARFHAAEGKE